MQPGSRWGSWLLLASTFVCVGSSWAQTQAPPAAPKLSSSLGMVVYPAQKQTAAVQQRDEQACYGWSQQQTGVDPVALGAAPKPQAAPSGRGAGAGAAGGAAVGIMTGHPLRGAVVGGALGSAAESNKQKQVAQQAQAQVQQQMTQFRGAFGTCLRGRGYTVY